MGRRAKPNVTGETYYVELVLESGDAEIVETVSTFEDALDFAADFIVRKGYDAFAILAGDLDGPHEVAARVEAANVAESDEAFAADAELVLTIDAPGLVPKELLEVATRSPRTLELEYGPRRAGGQRDQSTIYVQLGEVDASAMRFAMMDVNPSPSSDEVSQAIDKYKEFHRLDPNRTEELGDLVIPRRVRSVGPARHVLYRSGKVDPDTLRRPKKPVDYIHEHDAGVVAYVTDGRADTDVPEEFSSVTAIVKLGKCLGFALRDGTEAEGTAPLPDLACTPDGKCLLVIQGKRKVLAMMWGGALGVFARGIDG